MRWDCLHGLEACFSLFTPSWKSLCPVSQNNKNVTASPYIYNFRIFIVYLHFYKLIQVFVKKTQKQNGQILSTFWLTVCLLKKKKTLVKCSVYEYTVYHFQYIIYTCIQYKNLYILTKSWYINILCIETEILICLRLIF